MLQPFISKAFISTIWRLEIDEITNIMALELRDQQDQQVSFASIDLSTGETYLSNYSTDERWMTGLEGIYDGVIMLHHYKRESAPEHKAILTVDATTGTGLWSNYSIAFDHLTINGPVVYNANIQPVKLMLADVKTGALLRPFNKITDKPLTVNIVVPEVVTPAQLPDLQLPYEAYGNIVHYANYNNYRIVSLHALKEAVLNQHIFVMQDDVVIYHDLFNTGIQKLQPEAFVLHQNALIYIKNKAEIRVIKL